MKVRLGGGDHEAEVGLADDVDPPRDLDIGARFIGALNLARDRASSTVIHDSVHGGAVSQVDVRVYGTGDELLMQNGTPE